ncbi:MAG: serine/threonine protein kinase [Actinomycetota bacterium]|nr:serine/threonine protein kinase [Actinomycetota bacterium]
MPSELPVGTEIAGHRIETLIGRGGMGAVYLAEHLRLRRRVALKVLIPDLAQDETFRARFIRESQIAASLDHPNVVTVYDAGEAEGVLYISMRYVDGPNLGKTIREEGPLDPAFAASVIDQVGGALDAAHALGLVHRDVKPANILLSRPGEARTVRAFLTDFGITKRMGAATQFTQTGQLVGTYTYMAPEQIRGDPLDGRTDIYSLGCIVYESLTARPPFGGDSPMELMFSHMNQKAPSVRIRRPELPEAVDRVIERGMAKDREDRYPLASDLSLALREALGLAPASTVTAAPSAVAPTIAAPGSPSASPPAPAPTVPTPIPAAPSFPSAPSAPPAPSAPSTPGPSTPGPAGPPGPPPAPPTRAVLAGTVAEPQVRQPPPGRRGPRAGLIAAVIVVLAAVVAGAVIFLGKGKSTSNTSTSGSPTSGPATSHPATSPPSPTPSRSGHGSPTPPTPPPPVVRDWQRIDSSAFGGSGNQTMNRVLATDAGVLAVGYDGPADNLDAAVWTSVNGRTWSQGSVPSEPGNQGIAAVAPGGPGYVAVGSTDSATGTDAAVWSSRDGSTWTEFHSQVFGGSGDQAMRRVVVAPPGLVAVGSDGSGGDLDAAVWLFDGQTWSIERSTAFGGAGDQEMRSAVPFQGGLVAVGFASGGNGTDAAVWRSPDGTSWTRVRSNALGGPGDQIMITVEQGGPGLVAVGSTNENGDEDAAVWTSSNGTTWQRVNDPAVFGGPGDQEAIGIVSTASGLVAAGFDLSTTDAVVWTSSDGRTWVRKDIAQLGGSGTQQIKGIASFGRDLVAVGRIRQEGVGGRDEDAGVWVGSPA